MSHISGEFTIFGTKLSHQNAHKILIKICHYASKRNEENFVNIQRFYELDYMKI